MKAPKDPIFINPKPCMALIAIQNQNKKAETGLNRNDERAIVSDVAKAIDTTYAHTCKIISKLEDKGFIDPDPKGRKKYLELTDYGAQQAELFETFIKIRTDSTPEPA